MKSSMQSLWQKQTSSVRTFKAAEEDRRSGGRISCPQAKCVRCGYHAKNETDQFLLEFKAKGQAQTQKLALYIGAIAKIWEDMAILVNRTDDALNTFAEYFLSLR